MREHLMALDDVPPGSEAERWGTAGVAKVRGQANHRSALRAGLGGLRLGRCGMGSPARRVP